MFIMFISQVRFHPHALEAKDSKDIYAAKKVLILSILGNPKYGMKYPNLSLAYHIP